MSANSHSHEDHGVAHVMPFKILMNVFLALMVLTVVTVAVTLVDFGSTYNLLVALAIAVVKAALVVLYFMHLRYDNPFNAIIFIGCLVFVALFLTFSMLDTGAYHGSVIKKQADKLENNKIDVQALLKKAAEQQQPAPKP